MFYPGMDTSSGPLMRKLLIGQLFQDPTNLPKYDSVRQLWEHSLPNRPPLLWGIVWLQGTVTEYFDEHSVVLDDGTGRIRIDCLKGAKNNPISTPEVGEYIAVIGDLVCPTEQSAGQVSEWYIAAKLLVTLSERQSSEESSTQLADLNVALFELSWPLEVMDMIHAL
ncbi:unnamed protein product [Calicophoron daubneyi]|uniref:RecQ-mediated genome instability protein 2 n=1 Tax=Calicophoron daubneyi TaxID=300641 RepID=A0AAV2T274_CALDB